MYLIQDLQSLSQVFVGLPSDLLAIYRRGLPEKDPPTRSKRIKVIDTEPNATSRNKSLTPFWGPKGTVLRTPMEYGKGDLRRLFSKKNETFFSLLFWSESSTMPLSRRVSENNIFSMAYHLRDRIIEKCFTID